MPLDAYDVTAICPYYKSHAKLSITCEWLKSKTVTVKHGGTYAVIRYLSKRCCTRKYDKCPIAAINDAYHGNAHSRPVERRKIYPRKITAKEIPGQMSLF